MVYETCIWKLVYENASICIWKLVYENAII